MLFSDYDLKILRRGDRMTKASQIRTYARQKYVLPARQRKQQQFSINAGDVVREMKLTGRVPAVCSALKTREFLERNELDLVGTSGPTSGQSTTVTYTYEFIDRDRSLAELDNSWTKLRGALKDVFGELGGGEAYLRSERSAFHSPKERE
jgi:hypothetical protein